MDARLKGDRLVAFADLRTHAVLEGHSDAEVVALAIIETPAVLSHWNVESGNVIRLADAVVGVPGVAYFVFELTRDADIVEDWLAQTAEDARDIARSVYSDAQWEEFPNRPEALSTIKARLAL